MGSIAQRRDSGVAVADNQPPPSPTKKQRREERPAECHGPELHDIDQCLWNMFAKTAEEHPNKHAVISLWQDIALPTSTRAASDETEVNGKIKNDNKGSTRWTYADLLQATEVLATWLKGKGCVKSMNLVAFVLNSAEWALFFWVAARLKMVYVPLDPRVSDEGVEDLVQRTNPYVLVIQDATSIALLGQVSENIAIRICCSGFVEGWSSPPKCLEALSEIEIEDLLVDEHNFTPPGEDTALIVFTSGTTATPKGCPHTARNLWTQSFNFDPNVHGNYEDKWLVHTPVFHIFAINNALRAWRHGGCVVLPSKSFDIKALIRGLTEEKCSRMSAIPTLVHALKGHPDFPGKEALSIKHISIGGTMISEADVKVCESFTDGGHALTAYGMSEGAPMVMWSRSDYLLKDGFYPGVGKILPGFRMRICSTETKKVCGRNEVGELHIGGSGVINGYLGGVGEESFYADEFGRWLITGDQACIDDNDVLQVTGRIKDIIIRGGENIPPAKIEAHLMRNVPGLVVHIVGVPDALAGEVPVAVVNAMQSNTKAQLNEIAKQLGSIYALDDTLTLEELGLPSFPTTVTGKVRKESLKKTVVEFIRQKELAQLEDLRISEEPSLQNGDSSQDALIQKLVAIWTDLANVAPDPDDHISEFSDSITLLRYCDGVSRMTGKKIYLPDFERHPSITLQAKLLQSRSSKDNKLNLEVTNRREALKIGDVLFANQDSMRFELIADAADGVLRASGLTWKDDAENIIPIRDWYWAIAKGQRPQTYHHRIRFKLEGKYSAAMRPILEKGLDGRPMFRSVIASLPDGTPFHAVVRPSAILYNKLITERTVLDMAAMEGVYQDDSNENFPRDQMFRACLVRVEHEQAAFMILTYNHSVFDAMTMVEWYRDLDQLFVDPTAELTPQTPFQLFAEVVHLYDTSSLAKASVDFNIHRLRGISKCKDAFWPPKRTPGFMNGIDTGSPHHLARLEHREKHNMPPVRPPRVFRMLKSANIPNIRAAHKIHPSILVKTAVALFNIQQTGHEYAVFNNLDAGREWPFLLPQMKNAFPPAMTVDGPMLEWTLNLIRVLPLETVGALLQRIGAEQKQLSKHVHAPWFKVLEGLGEEAVYVKDAVQRQSFNWDVSLRSMLTQQTDYTALKPMGRLDWPDCGIYWVAGTLSNDTLCVVASFDDAQLSMAEVEGYADTLSVIINGLLEPENWDLGVAQILGKAQD